MKIVIDTETTGLVPKGVCYNDEDRMPYIVEIACILCDDELARPVASYKAIIKPMHWVIPRESSLVHGIDQHYAERYGLPPKTVLEAVLGLMRAADQYLAYNAEFDAKVLFAALYRAGMPLPDADWVCLMQEMTDRCQIPSQYSATDYKWPNLAEAFLHATGRSYVETHAAMADCEAARRIYSYILQDANDAKARAQAGGN